MSTFFPSKAFKVAKNIIMVDFPSPVFTSSINPFFVFLLSISNKDIIWIFLGKYPKHNLFIIIIKTIISFISLFFISYFIDFTEYSKFVLYLFKSF